MSLSRRALLGAAMLSLAGCAGASASQLATDVQLVADGLAAAIADIAKIPGIASDTLTRLQGDLATIEGDAAKVAADTADAGTGAVQEIAAGVRLIAGIVLPLSGLPGTVATVINAAVSLLPAILAAAGLVGASVTAPAYTPEQARLILRAAH